MKIKCGERWFEVGEQFPIMVVLSDKDKQNISNMPEYAQSYAIFHDDSPLTADEMHQWMTEEH